MKRYVRNIIQEDSQPPERQLLIKEMKALQKPNKRPWLEKDIPVRSKRAARARIKKAKLKERRSPNLIEYYAKQLEEDLPASERWFRDMYLKEEIVRTFSEDLFKDRFNKSFNKIYIPDVCNIGYKYIIEVDGSIHNTPEQKYKDLKKDYYFEKRGYLVIRVKYGDNAGYSTCVSKVKARVLEIDIIEQSRRST